MNEFFNRDCGFENGDCEQRFSRSICGLPCECETGGSTFFRNVAKILRDLKASHIVRQLSLEITDSGLEN
jgi:hypothetical protein